MKKEFKFVLITAIAVLSGVFLYFRPKYVVKTEKVEKPKKEKQKEEMHLISETARKEIDSFKSLPSTADLNEKIALVFMKESAFDSAAVYYEKASVQNPQVSSFIKTADAYNQALSLAIDPLKADGFGEKAREYYGKVLKASPDNLYAMTNMAGTYVRTETPMKGITLLREVIELNPNYIPALLSLGGLSMQSNQYDKAVGRFEKVLKVDPSNVNAKLGLAYSFIELKRGPEAKDILNALLKTKLDPVMKDEVIKTLNTIK